MKIRLHLVRFMYINLILSCCFWLYDNAAAADEFIVNAAAAESLNAAGEPKEGVRLHMPQDPLATAGEGTSNEKVPIVLNDYKNSKEVASEEEAPATATAAATTTTCQDADSVGLKLGKAPRTSAKTTNPGAIKDTSVNLNGLPSPNVNINNNNNNNEHISVVHHSERNNNNAENDEATAKVPKNLLNNKINHNIYTNTNSHANQLEQSQQAELVDDVMIPKTVPQQQQQQQKQQQESFSEIITELPSVSLTELPLQLEPVKESLDAVILQETPPKANNKSAKEQQEQPPAGAKKVAQKDDINDPGGGLELDAMSTAEANATLDANVTSNGGLTSESEGAAGSNETVEEVPMPVFSEWAQKQMEAEASREQAMELEQQVVNNSAQRRNATGAGNGKLPSLKLRAKNYASPDCGAKIIASNADATNTGAVLSHSSDEYMLSTCGSRIWFVVELCEAVQAQKVELANFELFSSSPRNFTVAVSKRFPTRDWSNVGRFAAEDKRTVQTFELHPHLFGKFVRVDIHSHYSKEHFCPISLFRVFGTSEYEAFETEIRHSDELDDFDDDFAGQEQAHKTSPGNANGGSGNIFQSASDAVMQMVKKAAQVLVKPTKALRWSTESILCHTPATGVYSCPKCNSTTVERINNLLSCQSQQLQLLLSLPQLRSHLLQTRVCQAEFEINLGLASNGAPATSGMDKRQSFYLSMLPAEHVGAVCKILQAEYNTSIMQPVEPLEQQNLDIVEQHIENVTTPDPTVESAAGAILQRLPHQSLLEITSNLEKLALETSTATEPAATATHSEVQPADSSTVAPTPADVNIFNVPSDSLEVPTAGTSLVSSELPEQAATTHVDATDVEAAFLPSSTVTPPTAESVNGDLVGSGNGIDDSNLANWENIDSLLTTTVASITAGGGAAAAAAAVVNGNANLGGTANAAATAAAAAGGGINLQPKLTHGAQSESVFIRLSNRIKALERNMSLSGQYLEELSRRYKKQVEELQQTLTQQTLTVRTLEDQGRRFLEQEQLYKQQSAELAGEVRALTYQVQACILVVIIVGTCIFLMLVLGTVYYRKLRRQTQQLQPQPTPGLTKQNLSRRKSYEQIVEQAPGEKRRPSEEAMLIMNGCGDVSVTEPSDVGNVGRQRKISVCYGSNNNIAASMFNARASLHRRKAVKHASLDASQVTCGEQSDQFFDVETLKSNKLPPKVPKKKTQQVHQQELKRQESAPANFIQGGQLDENTQSDFDESLILDDEDLCNFIPNSDLAYNEFMPDGPSGYQIVDAVDGKTDKAHTTVKKSRRVSSPAFFKSPFSKSKNKGGAFNGIGGVKGSHSAHEATSWEWYRLKRNEKQSKQLTGPSVSVSANASLDSSSLSEINFPYNASQNSFRILGEAILCSEESRPNGKSTALTAGSSSSSGASTTSSTTKKKQRAFNNIFRKVF